VTGRGPAGKGLMLVVGGERPNAGVVRFYLTRGRARLSCACPCAHLRVPPGLRVADSTSS